ncbi:hypothetical protein ACP4OV_026258 [Aristida adscensionis]
MRTVSPTAHMRNRARRACRQLLETAVTKPRSNVLLLIQRQHEEPEREFARALANRFTHWFGESAIQRLQTTVNAMLS